MKSNEDGDKSPSKSVSNFIGYDDIDEDFIEIIIADRQWLNNGKSYSSLWFLFRFFSNQFQFQQTSAFSFRR